MSDFFSGIYAGSSRGPDIVMNRGPLPPTSSAGMPPGFNGTPDARIDYSSSLLGDLEPYAYGEPGRLSTQAAYLNIPHVAQRIVPQINLPEAHTTASGGGVMGVTHQVDDGDVAFVIRAMFSPYEIVSDKKKYCRQGILYAIDPVVNLATVNYILHGLQRYGWDSTDAKNWHAIWVAFEIDGHFMKLLGGRKMSDCIRAEAAIAKNPASSSKQRQEARLNITTYRKMLCTHVVKDLITPFGVPRGSERQGGQHQGIVNRSVTNPVDFVTAMVVDGKVINLANFWRDYDVNAGDDLIMHLEERTYTSYTLSHHPKSARTVNFEPLETWEDSFNGLLHSGTMENNPACVKIRHAIDVSGRYHVAGDKARAGEWSLRADKALQEILADSRKRSRDGSSSGSTLVRALEPIFQLVPSVASSPRVGVQNAVWHDGYWHIARSQVMLFRHDVPGNVPNGSVAATSGRLLEATFSPVWIEPLEHGLQCGIGVEPVRHKKAPAPPAPPPAPSVPAGGGGLPAVTPPANPVGGGDTDAVNQPQGGGGGGLPAVVPPANPAGGGGLPAAKQQQGGGGGGPAAANQQQGGNGNGPAASAVADEGIQEASADEVNTGPLSRKSMMEPLGVPGSYTEQILNPYKIVRPVNKTEPYRKRCERAFEAAMNRMGLWKDSNLSNKDKAAIYAMGCVLWERAAHMTVDIPGTAKESLNQDMKDHWQYDLVDFDTGLMDRASKIILDKAEGMENIPSEQVVSKVFDDIPAIVDAIESVATMSNMPLAMFENNAGTTDPTLVPRLSPFYRAMDEYCINAVRGFFRFAFTRFTPWDKIDKIPRRMCLAGKSAPLFRVGLFSTMSAGYATSILDEVGFAPNMDVGLIQGVIMHCKKEFWDLDVVPTSGFTRDARLWGEKAGCMVYAALNLINFQDIDEDSNLLYPIYLSLDYCSRESAISSLPELVNEERSHDYGGVVPSGSYPMAIASTCLMENEAMMAGGGDLHAFSTMAMIKVCTDAARGYSNGDLAQHYERWLNFSKRSIQIMSGCIRGIDFSQGTKEDNSYLIIRACAISAVVSLMSNKGADFGAEMAGHLDAMDVPENLFQPQDMKPGFDTKNITEGLEVIKQSILGKGGGSRREMISALADGWQQVLATFNDNIIQQGAPRRAQGLTPFTALAAEIDTMMDLDDQGSPTSDERNPLLPSSKALQKAVAPKKSVLDDAAEPKKKKATTSSSIAAGFKRIGGGGVAGGKAK